MTERQFRLGEELHDALTAAGGYTVITSKTKGSVRVLVRTLNGVKLPPELVLRLKDFGSLLKEYVLERYGKEDEDKGVCSPSRFGSFRKI